MKILNDIIYWFIFGGFLAALIVFWEKDLHPFFQNKIDSIKDIKTKTADQILLNLANTAVIAVEYATKDNADIKGNDKKQMAVQKVDQELKNLGLNFSEQAVFDTVQYAFNMLIGSRK